MKFSEPFIEGTLIKRYKRFLADIKLADGNIITAHTPNTAAQLPVPESGYETQKIQIGNTRIHGKWSKRDLIF